MEVWRLRMREHAQAAYVHLFVNEGEGGGATRPHTHAQLVALDFVPALIARERERFGAYASRRWASSCSTTSSPRRCGGASASSRSTTRRCCSSPYAARAALPADGRAAPPPHALRGRRADPARDAPRGAGTPRAPLGDKPAAEPLDPHRAARRRALLLADRHRSAAARDLAGLELGSGLRLNMRHARAGRRASCARREGARPARLARRRAVEGETVARSARDSSSCSGSGTTTAAADRRPPGREDPRAARVRRRRGADNEPLGEREVLCVSQFTLLRRHRRGQPPELRGAAAPSRRSAL